MMYTFKLTTDGLQDDPIICELSQSLFDTPAKLEFIEAMHFVTQPELCLQHHLQQVIDNKSSLEQMIQDLFESNEQFQGRLYEKISKYRYELESADEQKLAKIKQKLTMDMKKRIEDSQYKDAYLKNFSPYLDRICENEMEVPGQYQRNKKPMPQYHAKIAKIDSYVKIMFSKLNPIKITMIGSDAKEYSFLIKFGEDLRLDQRLQQIFEIANQTLSNDLICRRKYLALKTYQVIPFSKSVGLIQWVDNTKSMREFIEFSCIDKTIARATENYSRWIKKMGRGLDSFRAILKKYSADEVISKMDELAKSVGADSLRKTFLTISPSLESFMSMRRNFISTYGTMCMVHWVMGVGDRHLENTLIEIKSGCCLGIDFGLSFGAGIDQLVPELVPFRLTRQILELLKPFTEKDSFATIMNNVLQSLKNEQGPLLASLDVFINESLDWNKDINKELRKENEENEEKRIGNGL